MTRDVDPVGACVGMKGTRVQIGGAGAARREDRHRALDARSGRVRRAAPWRRRRWRRSSWTRTTHAMEVIVPDDQLSLAIGKKGQNVRLASRLTGWKLDVRSESEAEDEARQARLSLSAIPGVGDVTAELLYPARLQVGRGGGAGRRGGAGRDRRHRRRRRSRPFSRPRAPTSKQLQREAAAAAAAAAAAEAAAGGRGERRRRSTSADAPPRRSRRRGAEERS